MRLKYDNTDRKLILRLLWAKGIVFFSPRKSFFLVGVIENCLVHFFSILFSLKMNLILF